MVKTHLPTYPTSHRRGEEAAEERAAFFSGLLSREPGKTRSAIGTGSTARQASANDAGDWVARDCPAGLGVCCSFQPTTACKFYKGVVTSDGQGESSVLCAWAGKGNGLSIESMAVAYADTRGDRHG